VDSSGAAYVTGTTESTTFPIVNPLPFPTYPGVANAFVSKLKFDNLTSTLSLIYSTLLGGSSPTIGFGIAIDTDGNVYVTGQTDSSTFPTVNPLPPPNNTLQGSADAFVSKLSFNSSPAKLTLIYSIFLGGSGFEQGISIAVDANGNAYVSGLTESSDFPTVHPLPPPNNHVKGQDVFVTKVSAKEESKKK
jgi:hypothetical protein